MYRHFSWLATQYDYRLVLLAVLVCAGTAVTAFQTYSRFADAQPAEGGGRHRVAWLCLTGVGTAAGISATHVLAMLAYDWGLPTAYDLVLSIVSLVVGAVITTAGFSLSAQGGQRNAVAGGAVIGSGIGAMYFTGMQALIVPGMLAWDAPLVAASVVIGMVLGSAALVAYHRLERRQASWAAAGLLAVAICGVHFTGMAAATIVADPTLTARPTVIDSATLAVAMVAVTMLVIVAALAMAAVDAQAERVSPAGKQEPVEAGVEGLIIASGGRIVGANRRIVELSGWSASELVGKSVVGDLLAGAVESASAASMKTTEAFLRTACGDLVRIEVAGQELHGGGKGQEVYAIRGLSERGAAERELPGQNEALQQREEELRQQNLRFDLTLRNMAQGLCVFDAEQRLVICNKAYLRMYNLSPDEAKPGTTLREILEHRIGKGFFAGTDPGAYMRERFAAVADGRAATAIHHLTDGRTICVRHQPIPGGGWITSHEDITEREKLRVQLEESNRLLSEQTSVLQMTVDNFPGGISLLDSNLRVVLLNEKAKRILDLPDRLFENGSPSLEEVFRFNASRGEYGPGEVEEQVAARMALARARKPHVFERKRPDGTVLEVRGVPLAGGGFVTTYTDVTERSRLTARLEQQNALLREQEEKLATQNSVLDAALNSMSQGLAMFDADERLVIANGRFSEMYGETPEQAKPGTTLREILSRRVPSTTTDAVLASIRSRVACKDISHWTGKIPDRRTMLFSIHPRADGTWVSTQQDITERETLKDHLDAALNNMAQGLAMFDAERRLVICNNRFADMYGLSPEQVRPGTTLRQIVEHRLANGNVVGKTAEQLMDALSHRLGDSDAGQYTMRLTDGRCIAVSVQPMPDGGRVTTHQDITEQQRAEAKIQYMALHDSLTELPNRVQLNERLQSALTRVERGEIVATHLLDLDRFKIVNDTLGHAAGDKLLKMVTERLRGLLRPTDTIARMGGDEFAIVQVAVEHPSDVAALAERIIEAISEPYDIDGHQVSIGTSVGVALAPLDGDDPQQLIRNADLALYGAKGEGRGRYHFFEPEMDRQMQTRRAMECDLRKALAAGEFDLHYQPIVNLESNEIIAFEALVRWRHPERGMVPPGEFMSLAEDIGFIVPLGEWVLRSACAAAANWPHNLKVAVNVSPAQFRSSGLVQVVVGALAASGLSPGRLELEITEAVLLEDKEATLRVLYQLRELGVGVAMDDFGTGYSSLSYLQTFPFDRIKIDQSFVNDVNESATSLNIVRAIAALAKGLCMSSTAEGVETQEQLDAVKSEGCTEMQGFYFSRARPLAEIEQLFLSKRKATSDADAASAA